MKTWPKDHPKAKLMAGKRSSILAAARAHFLRDGYEGVSMETIATTAAVSIMTLYRHAANKEDLFIDVVQAACEHSPESMKVAAAEATTKPLASVLVQTGSLFQEKLLQADTVALLRAVIRENARFPQLAKTAYQEFIAVWIDNLCDFLGERSDIQTLSAAYRRELVADFIDDLVSTAVLRELLGLNGSNPEQYEHRAEIATERFLAKLMSVHAITDLGQVIDPARQD